MNDEEFLYKTEEEIEVNENNFKDYIDITNEKSFPLENEEIITPLNVIVENLRNSQNNDDFVQHLQELIDHNFTFDDKEMDYFENSELIENLVSFLDHEFEPIQKLSLNIAIRLCAKNSDVSCLFFECGVCKAASKFLNNPETMRYAISLYLNIMSHDSLMAKRIEHLFPVSEAKKIIDSNPDQILLNTLIRYIFQVISNKKDEKNDKILLSYCLNIFQEIIEGDSTESIVLVLSCLYNAVIEKKLVYTISQNMSFIDSILNLIGKTTESSILSRALRFATIFAKLKLLKTVSKKMLGNIIFYSHSPNNLVQSTALWCLSEFAYERIIQNPVKVAFNFIRNDLESLQSESTSTKEDAAYFISLLLKEGKTGDFSDLFEAIDIFSLYKDLRDIENEKICIAILESFKHLIEVLQTISPEISIPEKLSEYEFEDYIDEWIDSDNPKISSLGEFFQSFFNE